MPRSGVAGRPAPRSFMGVLGRVQAKLKVAFYQDPPATRSGDALACGNAETASPSGAGGVAGTGGMADAGDPGSGGTGDTGGAGGSGGAGEAGASPGT